MMKLSAINALYKIKNKYPDAHYIFVMVVIEKDNIPEMEVEGIDFVFSVGGDDKKNSSSWILKNWQYDSEKTESLGQVL